MAARAWQAWKSYKSHVPYVASGMDKLVRYLVTGGILIVVGIGLVAFAGTGLPFSTAESIGLLGVIAMVLGLVMVIGAIWIDLTSLQRERLKQGQPAT